MWCSWPSTAHQLHRLPLKFMKPSSFPLPRSDIACQRLLLLKWDIYDSEPSPHESGLLNHLNAAEGGTEMRYGRLLERATCASSLSPICQFPWMWKQSLVLSTSSRKSWSQGFEDESFLVLPRALSPPGAEEVGIEWEGVLSSAAYCFAVHCKHLASEIQALFSQTRSMQTEALSSRFKSVGSWCSV